MLSLNCIFAFLFVLANTRCLCVSTSERSSYHVWTLQDEELARDRNIGRIQYKPSSSSRYSSSPSSSQASKDSSRFSGSPSQASQASLKSSHFSPSSFPSEASREYSSPSFTRYSASPSQFESSASRPTASASSSTSSSRKASSLPLRSGGKVWNPSSGAAEPVLVRLNTVKDNSVWTAEDEGLSRHGHLGRVQYKTASSPRHSSSPSLSPASRVPSARSPFYSNSRTEDAELNERVGLLFNSIDQNQDGFMDSLELTRASHANNVRITEAEAITAANVAFTKPLFGDLLSLSPSSKPTDLLHFLIHATGALNRPRNKGFRTSPTSSDLKKELHLKLQHVFLYLDVDHNCVLEVSDLVSIFNDIERPISAEIAGNLLTVDSQALVGVDFNHWRALALTQFIKSNIGQYWKEVFEDVEKIFGGALPPVTDTAIEKAAKFAVDNLAHEQLGECFQIDLVNVQAARVTGRDDGVEYKLELRVNTKSGSNCVDQVLQVVEVVVLKPLAENCLDASSLRLVWGQISSEIICAPDVFSSGVCSCEAGVGGARTVCTSNQGCTSAGTCQDACNPGEIISGDNCFCRVPNSVSGTSCSVGQGCNKDGSCLDVCSRDEISSDSCFCKDPISVSGKTCSSNQGCDQNGQCLDACSPGEVNSVQCICSDGVLCSANQGCGQDGACYDACTSGSLATDDCFCKSQTGNTGEKCSTGLGCDAAGNCLQVCTAGETNAASCFCKTSPTGDSGKACSANQGCTDTGECLDVCDQSPDNVCFCEGDNNQGVKCTASKICDNGKCYEASSFPDNKCFLEHLFQYNIGTNHYESIQFPQWTITVEGTTLSQLESARPSVGITQLGDPAKSASFKGEIHSDDDTDGDVLGMVFGFNDATNFFVVASSRDKPGPTNWYVGRLHATCGVSCHNTKDISNAIWKPSDYPSEITVLKQGDSPWLAGKRYVFSICFNPAELLLDVTVTQKDTGAVVLDTAGKVTAATGKTAVDDISRKGGFIGVYVDSQKQAHWTALECSSCDIEACGIGVNQAECFCSDGANGGTLCAGGQSCDGAGSCACGVNQVNHAECFCSDGANGGTLCAGGQSCDGAGSCDIPCYGVPSTSQQLECANGKMGYDTDRWNGCVDQGSVRVRCPEGHYPCNELRDNGKEFKCGTTCENQGGIRRCKLKELVCFAEPSTSDQLECANGKMGDRWNGCVDQGSVRVRCPRGHYPCNELRDNLAEFRCGTTCENYGGKRTCSSTGRVVYLLAGGYGGLNDIEIYDPSDANLHCSITPELESRYINHGTFYHNNTIYLCGGDYGKSTCTSHSPGTGWKTYTITTSRTYGHNTVVLHDRVYIIGGEHKKDGKWDYLAAESTPLPLPDTPVLTPEPNLDYKGIQQCTARIDQDTLVITGGWHRHNGDLSTVSTYNGKTGTFTQLPSLKQGRKRHGCGVWEEGNDKWIIVAGGYNNNDGGVLQTTEILQLGGREWISIGNLNVPRQGHSMVVTERGVMAMGGQDGSNDKLSSVELLDWSTKTWSLVEPSLKKGRSRYGGAVEIPASLYNCTA